MPLRPRRKTPCWGDRMNVDQIFNSENKFFTAMSKAWDVIVLNFYFLLTVVLGIGPAMTALYYAMVKNVRRSRSYATKSYFHSFAQNFKQGFIIGIIQLATAAGLYYCWGFAMSMDGSQFIAQVYFTVWFVACLLFVLTSIYVYPLLSRFNLTIGKAIKEAFVFSLRYLPYTLAMMTMFVISAIGIWLLGPMGAVIIPAVYTLCKSFVMERVLRKHTPKPEGEEANVVDAWYLE